MLGALYVLDMSAGRTCRSDYGQKRARGTLTFAQNLLGQLVAVLDGRMRLFVALFCPREKPRRWVRAQL